MNSKSKDKMYKKWLEELKNQIQASQIKAAIRVNRELLDLYWRLGEEISVKQKESNWVDAIIEQLSKNLTRAFPRMKILQEQTYFSSVNSCTIGRL